MAVIEDGSSQDIDEVAGTSLLSVDRRTSGWLARLGHITGLDRAIAYTVLARAWSAAAGVITVLMITRFLTPKEQGYYYTFFSLFALQIVFELGFCFVILQLAAHERAQLTIDSSGLVTGNPIAHARLASVLQQAVRWYSRAALLMFLTILPAGLYFFSTQYRGGADVAWRVPWCLLILATALTFQMDPVCAFVEGCGFVSQMAKMRVWQAVLSSLLGWTAMLSHHGLYAPALLIFGNAAMQFWFLSRSHLRRLVTGLLRLATGINSVNWRQEVWPFQWRIAITWISTYLIFQLLNPVLFAFEGPVTAGRIGMSLSIASSIGSVGLAWMSTKASPFGAMIARQETKKLDSLFFRTLWQSTALTASLAAVFLLCLIVTENFYPSLAVRMLPPSIFGMLLLTTVLNHVVSSEALYLRAHKREPLVLQTVVIAVVLGIFTVLSARMWGATAVVVGYFLFGGVLSFAWATFTFVVKRYEWHGRSAAAEKP